LKPAEQIKVIDSFKAGLLNSGITVANSCRVITDLYKRLPKVRFTFFFGIFLLIFYFVKP
jgi:hypothetical protein